MRTILGRSIISNMDIKLSDRIIDASCELRATSDFIRSYIEEFAKMVLELDSLLDDHDDEDLKLSGLETKDSLLRDQIKNCKLRYRKESKRELKYQPLDDQELSVDRDRQQIDRIIGSINSY